MEEDILVPRDGFLEGFFGFHKGNWMECAHSINPRDEGGSVSLDDGGDSVLVDVHGLVATSELDEWVEVWVFRVGVDSLWCNGSSFHWEEAELIFSVEDSCNVSVRRTVGGDPHWNYATGGEELRGVYVGEMVKGVDNYGGFY